VQRVIAWYWRSALLAATIALWAGLAPALAEKRVALVIGNSAYRDVPALANPRNDAEDVAAALKRLGFETTVGLDADRAAMERAIEAFATAVEGADVALFYYAGHGMQHQGVNYLMPTDANLQNAAGLRRLTKLNDVVADVKRARTLRIMILDACRDNPLVDVLENSPSAVASRGVRSVGLAKMSRTAGSGDPGAAAPSRGGDIIVYAAESGHTAADGVGRNSPFSAAFVRNVETEGQEVVALVRRVALSVQQETNGGQRPELSLAVPFEFYFKPGPPQPPPTVLQLLPDAKPHEVGAIESQADAIVNAASEQDRAQIRRELMALMSEMASRSGLKPDQLATELPNAFSRLAKTRKEIEEFRRLMENEPGIAPFVEIAAAAVASGRRPDLQAADQALAQAQSRYDEAIRARTQALERTRSNRAHLYEQRGNIAETEYRSKEAAEFYLAAAKDTPAADLESTARRFALAGATLFVHGNNFFANDTLREAIRVMESEALRRYEQIVPGSDEQRRLVAASTAIVLANIADAQTSLGGRLPGYDGAKMMVDARATYRKALDRIKVEEFPDLAMDILNRRSQRDLEFGRRIVKDRGRGHFAEAVKTMRLILSIQDGKPAYKDELGRTRNNLANALKELSKRTDGEEGDRLIDEAIELFRQSVIVLEQLPDKNNVLIARSNVAHALGVRAERKTGLVGAQDIDAALEMYEKIGRDLDKEKNPRLWAAVKQNEAELLRLVGQRQTDPARALVALKTSFELYQKLLTVIAKDTAPNHWALICAEMGHTLVAALPLLDENDRRRMSAHAVAAFETAQRYFIAGGFGQDLEKLDGALKTASAAANPTAPPSPQPGKN
jgi:tetratricopeptide (TPR) repeat protein